ncbi:MAG: carbohydrate esterase [Deltaproteobacteria bacterium]|nr:carbohydrate esterase [Deltaproteobacteria bacterium]
MRARPALIALLALAACGDPITTTGDTLVTVDITTDTAADVGTDATATMTDASGDTAGTTTLNVTATVPPETPADAAIVVVSGEVSAPLVGGAGPLTSALTGTLATNAGASWRVELRPSAGPALVELDAGGQPVARTVAAGPTQDVTLEVARWGPATGQSSPEVAFLVRVPEGTATDTGIWVSGNQPALGDWDGAGVRLHATRDGRWAAVVAFTSGTTIEYKVTRGSWETVEKAADGAEIDNRRLEVNAPMTRPEIEVLRWRDQGGGGPPTGTGDIEIIPAVASAHLDEDRDLIVWLPPGYDTETTRRYPVLYMHDGQNLMDASTSAFGVEWGVDEAAQALVTSGEVAPLIIVGVYNTVDRIPEYTPTVDADMGQGGQADAYGRFLAEELKPMIDGRFRTDTAADATGLAGSSLGGLVSLYLGLERPETFRRLGVVSPSVWWDERDIIDRVTALEAKPPLRIWLDIGTAEGGGESVEDTRLLRDALVAEGWALDEDLHYLEVAGAAHDEAAWAARIDDILRWLYPAE